MQYFSDMLTARCPSASTRWTPAVVTPGEVVSQVKEWPGSSSVTRQRVRGRRGCLTMASLPTRKVPLSTRRTSRMLRVISGQRSRSMNNRQTSSAGASAMAVTRCSILNDVPFGTCKAQPPGRNCSRPWSTWPWPEGLPT